MNQLTRSIKSPKSCRSKMKA